MTDIRSIDDLTPDALTIEVVSYDGTRRIITSKHQLPSLVCRYGLPWDNFGISAKRVRERIAELERNG